MAEIIDGRLVSNSIRAEIKQRIERINLEKGKRFKLATILVGDNPASKIYIKNKINACNEVGIESLHIDLPATTSEDELLKRIEELNNDPETDGILVQLPLPPHISQERVIESILPSKDVDGFHPYNQGILLTSKDYNSLVSSGVPIPCTPYGCIKLLEHYNIDVSGKNVVIIGRSNIVGKPLSLLFLLKNATVTICHSKTREVEKFTRSSDIIVCATGKKGLLSGDMIRENAIVLDVGINRGEDGKIYGDADFESVSKKASFITPVPGGVGPMTITMLLFNTLTLGLKRRGFGSI